MLVKPEIVRIKDVDYQVEPFTQEIQELYARYMQGSYLELIKKNKLSIGNDYLEMLQKYFFDVAKGLYDFGAVRFWEFVNNKKEFYELLWWCFSKHQPISREDVIAWIDTNPEEAALLFERLNSTLDDKKKE